MANQIIDISRSDIDIDHDVHQLLHSYPPVRADRHSIHVTVSEGFVTLSGHVRSFPNHQYVVNNVGLITGVTGIDHSQFFYDEKIRLETGQYVPTGVQVTVEYGTVILTGSVPQGVNVEALAGRLGSLPGVKRVVTSLAEDKA